MLKISRTERTFTRLETPTLSAAAILERADLQEYISHSPGAFFAELGETLFVLGKEVRPSETVQDRIDLLALDKDGKAVVIELKRGNDKLQLLQAIAYAGMVSKWSASDFTQLAGENAEALADFLNVEQDEVNRSQRILIIAEAYDYEVLAGAEWLYEQYGVEIACARVMLATDPISKTEYLTCTQIFPTPELAEQAIKRSQTGTAVASWNDWEQALASIDNASVVDFFNRCLASEQECYLLKRMVFFRLLGKRRWSVSARSKLAYTWQYGRFEGDLEFWSERLSQPTEVKAVKDGSRLRFYLSTTEDFTTFQKAITVNAGSRHWLPTDIDDVAAEGATA